MQEPIGREELFSYFADSVVPEEQRRVGLEWEKEAVNLAGQRLPFDGDRGIEALLKGLVEDFGWAPGYEQDRLVSLRRDGEALTLEPGSQLEFASAPRRRLVDLEIDLRRHLTELQQVTSEWEVRFLSTAFSPLQDCEDIKLVPKQRYQIMDDYLRPRGALAHEMMRGSTSVQVAFDYHSLSDCAHKLEAALQLSPVVTALLANSPLRQGQPNGFLSYRSRCWQLTDPERTGLLAGLGTNEYTAEAYLDWALKVPMMFMKVDGQMVAAKGLSFGRWLVDGLEGRFPSMADFELHLTSLFPEVRLKSYIELRGADNGTLERILAVAALWKGLLYDRFALGDSRELGAELAAGVGSAGGDAAMAVAIRDGLKGKVGGRSLQLWAAELLDIAAEGLIHQAPDGPAELAYLAPLQELVDSGRCPASLLLDSGVASMAPDELLSAIAYPPVQEIPAVSPEAGMVTS
ncbi:MAG: glutamate--cysteine ligase [Rickettsiales bacterium]|nr:glutamate--cysteine ligase [Rickettsiales bacterium]|tara:strand:- start:252 stop:1634 length:1383 start_codon:yes stop_codon:yes gene_type:complete